MTEHSPAEYTGALSVCRKSSQQLAGEQGSMAGLASSSSSGTRGGLGQVTSPFRLKSSGKWKTDLGRGICLASLPEL